MDTARYSLVEHLDDLRRAILASLAAVIIGTIIGYQFASPVMEIVKKPLPSMPLVYFGPFDGFYLQIRLAVISGIVLALPVIAASLVWFIGPALTPAEKKIGYTASIAAFFLFCLGSVYALYILLPSAVTFLLGFTTAAMLPAVAAEEYLMFVFSFIVYCGIAFNLPLFSCLLVSSGVLPTVFVQHYRKGFAMLMAGSVLFFSPGGDFTSQVLMVLPLFILFELSIFLAKTVRNFRIRGEINA